jgi:CysZ protein
VIGDFLKAVAQAGDPRFRGTLVRGVGLTLLLLVAIGYGFFWLVGWLVPDTFSIPWIGEVGWLDDAASWGALLLLLVASVFLMVPVASAFTGLFLDDVTDAVEALHYPHLPAAPRLTLAQSLRETLAFLGVIVLGNLVALVVYVAVPPFAPFVFVALNGYLLGREYFDLIARRRLGREGARRLRRRHGLQVWLAGVLMAAPLTVPIVNLLVPVLGAATFTHLFHRLNRAGPSG